MLFSTAVDPHWMKGGVKFWYTYETTAGKKWYVVDPVKMSKVPMFDNDKLAASQKNYSGVVIRALTVKNRFIKQYLEGEFYLSFSKGLDKYYGLLDIMKGMGVVDNSGSSYTDWTGDKLGYYKVWSKDIGLWENKLLPELEKRIKEHWAYGSSPDDDNLIELEEDEDTNAD
jgi:hypothetical protein